MDLNDEIAKVAYELFERGGKEHGKDQAHWLEAERIVKARHEGQTKKIREEKSRAAQQKTSIVRKTAGAKKTGASPKAGAKHVGPGSKKPARAPRGK
jgi:hypothetical protein